MFPILNVIKIISREVQRFKEPASGATLFSWRSIVSRLSRERRDPFRILVSTVLSLRTKDDCTAAASERLFALARTPHDMLNLPEKEIAKAIYPVGFYNTKAKHIKQICAILMEKYNGCVPADLERLLELPGVGRKTANLVITLGFGIPGICVDTHVHRITNRWGYVHTRAPVETEFALRKCLPMRFWIIINDLLVTYGQNICTPVSPRCSECRVEKWCARVGVQRSR
ncbi:MAG: endonuclease III [Candidatus Sumerlaeota bacterium]|nr:endonuclease III [Candidatus Sumerlaeota bacterium]